MLLPMTRSKAKEGNEDDSSAACGNDFPVLSPVAQSKTQEGQQKAESSALCGSNIPALSPVARGKAPEAREDAGSAPCDIPALSPARKAKDAKKGLKNGSAVKDVVAAIEAKVARNSARDVAGAASCQCAVSSASTDCSADSAKDQASEPGMDAAEALADCHVVSSAYLAEAPGYLSVKDGELVDVLDLAEPGDLGCAWPSYVWARSREGAQGWLPKALLWRQYVTEEGRFWLHNEATGQWRWE